LYHIKGPFLLRCDTALGPRVVLNGSLSITGRNLHFIINSNMPHTHTHTHCRS